MSGPSYPHPSQILFPNPSLSATATTSITSASPSSLGGLLASLRRSTLSLRNRLVSIQADAAFVARVAAALAGPGAISPARRPLVANERCGSWYVPPAHKAAAAYFKSTDGHARAWKFSTRRLNLHLVSMIEDHDGIIIVDSTRRGKRMPDALSTTVPVWCCVLNLVLLPDHPHADRLFLAPHLPPSTVAQVRALIPSFVAAFRALRLDLSGLRLSKPLRPLWITPDPADPLLDPHLSGGPGDEADDNGAADAHRRLFRHYLPVVCCTASRCVRGSETDQAGYVQGAADDAENWACGLTPSVFWAHADELVAAADADLPDLIAKLAQHAASPASPAPASSPAALAAASPSSRSSSSSSPLSSLWPPCRLLNSHLAVCPLPLPQPLSLPLDAAPRPRTCCVALTLTPALTPRPLWVRSPTHFEAGLGRHAKVASRNLRLVLPDLYAFVTRFFLPDNQPASLSAASSPPSSSPRLDEHGYALDHVRRPVVVIACPSGIDLAVGAALALSCSIFDDHHNFCPPPHHGALSLDKTLVKARLASIMSAYPGANPSRQTLQSVNSFLMDRPS